MSKALPNFTLTRKLLPDVKFDLLLSIHDAVILEVPGPCVKDVIEKVLPVCMCDGVELPGVGLHYTLGEPDIMLRWGEKASPEELLEIGVAREYCGFKE